MPSLPFPPPRLGDEPSLGELLDDPIVHLVMARDGVRMDELRRLIAVVSKQLRGGGETRRALC